VDRVLIPKELFDRNSAQFASFGGVLGDTFTDSKGVNWRKFGEVTGIFFICIFSDFAGAGGTRE
jgi:hypothetical protein